MVDEWKRKYEPLVERWKDGTLVQASKEELERFLVLVCLNGFRNNRIEHADPREIAETVRLLLQLRATEEMQEASNTTNRTVKRLTWFILVLTGVQVLIAGWSAFR